MARCEDFPCCGHGSDPGGCPDFENVRKCKECRRKFYPDNQNFENCPRCNAAHQIRHGYMDDDGHWVPGEDDER
jgi:hypothetical protein